MTHQTQDTRQQTNHFNPVARVVPAGRHVTGALLLTAAFIFGACAAPATDSASTLPAEATPATVAEPPAQATTQPSDESMAESDDMAEGETPESMAADTDADAGMDTGADASAMQDVPAWQTIALTNAVTGEQFTVADFAGKTIFVEPFATWCSNCRRQLGTVDSLRAQSDDNTVFLALSVEANIGDEALANYAAQTGYGLIFAAMTPELLQLLVAEYGQTITNPPATPHFVIGPDGTSSELFTGFRSSADIQALITAVGG